MKRYIIALCVLGLALGIGSSAKADMIFGLGQQLNRVWVGGFYPTSGETRDATDDIWFSFRYERVLMRNPQGTRELGVGLGWRKGSGSSPYETVENGYYPPIDDYYPVDGVSLAGLIPPTGSAPVSSVDVDLEVIPIFVNYRQFFPTGNAMNEYYWGVGLAAYLIDMDASVDAFDNDETKVGPAVMVGRRAGDWNYELRYEHVKFQGEQIGGLSLEFGYNF